MAKKVLGWVLLMIGADVGLLGSLVFLNWWMIALSAVMMLTGVYQLTMGEDNNGEGN